MYTAYRGVTKKIRTKIAGAGGAVIILIGSLSGALPLLTNTATAAGVAVTPADSQGWTATTTSGGQVNYVDVSGAPLGSGAVELDTASDNNAVAHLSHTYNTPLKDVSALSFEADQLSNGGNPSIDGALRISINFDGSGSTTDDQLMYEPYYNGTVTPNTWQTWNAANGKFWSNNSLTYNGLGGVSAGSYASNFTLADVLHDHPNATVVGLTLSLGTWNPSSQILFDNLTFNSDTYNFEGLPPAAPTNLHMLDNTHNNYAPLPAGVVPNSVNPAATDLVWTAPAGNINHYIVTTYKDGVSVGSAWVGTPNSWVGFSNGGFGLHGDGSYTFSVVAYDSAGQAGTPAISAAYIYDRTAPQITNITYNGATLSTNDLVSNTQTATIVANISEANPNRTYVEVDQLINNKWQKITGNWSTGSAANTATLTIPAGTLLEGAQLQVKVSTDDAAGNHASAAVPFTVDNTAPTITVKPGYVGDLTSKTFSNVSFSLYDAGQVDKYVLNGWTSDFSNNKWSDANFQNIKSHLVEGANTLTLYDVAGNSSSYTFTYDSTAPILTAKNATWNNPNVADIADGSTVSTAVDKDLRLFTDEKNIDKILMDGSTKWTGSWITDAGGVSIAYITSSTHTFQAVDKAGNKSNTITLTFDNEAPKHPTNLAVNGQSGTFYTKVGAPFTQTWKDKSKDVVKYNYVSCYVDTMPTSNSCPGTTYTTTTNSASKQVNSGDTKHDETFFWQVQAVDAAGNVSGWSDWSKVVVDSTGPELTYVGDSANDNVITPEFTATDAQGSTPLTFTWAADPSNPDGASISDAHALNPNFTVTNNGDYKFTLTASDRLGNTTTASFTFTYTAPSTSNAGASVHPNTLLATASTSNGGRGGGSNGGNGGSGGNNGNGGGFSGANGQVLGASTTTPNTPSTSTDSGDSGSSNSEVKGLSTTNQKAKQASNFLGLGWWWLPVIVAVLLFIFGLRRASNGTDKTG